MEAWKSSSVSELSSARESSSTMSGSGGIAGFAFREREMGEGWRCASCSPHGLEAESSSPYAGSLWSFPSRLPSSTRS